MPRLPHALALLLLASCSLACRDRAASGDGHAIVATPGAPEPAAKGKMPHGTVRFDTPRGTWALDVEIARSEDEHAMGLMFRRELGRDQGMIFVFPEAREQSFWMHNTLISLDMIFLDDDRSVVGVVASAEPRSETPRTVGKPARYVIEVPGGETAAHAVGPGARATFLGIDEPSNR